MGEFTVFVYRSYAYTQTGEIEEFETATGVPYWYNRRTGETYWEPPLPEPTEEEEAAEEEEFALRTLVKGRPNSSNRGR